MTPRPDTKRLREIAAAATPGAWFADAREVRSAPEGWLIAAVAKWPDRDFIAAARAAVPALCDRVEALEAGLAALRDDLAEALNLAEAGEPNAEDVARLRRIASGEMPAGWGGDGG